MLSSESVQGPIAHLHSLVHESARRDPLSRAQHRSFIASRLLGGLLALCMLSIYLAVEGMPSLLGAIGFLWLLSAIGIVVFLSRTGRFVTAHLISAVNFVGLVTWCAWLTGGLSSALLPWLVVIPLEAGLSTDRRIVTFAACVSGLGFGVLVLSGAVGFVPPQYALPISSDTLALLGAVSAMAYTAGLVMLLQMTNRQSRRTACSGEERYRLLAENANDMITRHDEKGRVVFASRAARTLLGGPVRKVLGNGLFERVHVADRPAYLSALSRCRNNAEPVAVAFRVHRMGARKTARYAWMEMRCAPMLRTEDGPAGGIVAITRDISAYKEQEQILLRARTEAESASRAKTQFLAGMSHELRTPLNAIIGFSEILDRELFGALGQERYRDYARLIHESGEHLLNVVNDILDMSKIEAGKFSIQKEPFDANTLVKSCRDIMLHTAEQKGLLLEVDTAQDIPELAADKRACKQMLLNVLSNAIKFTEPGGWVKLSASVEADNAVFAISDNGIGIADKDLPRLGDPFVQAADSYDRAREGAGLGLSVVRGLARLHGGNLEIASTLGKGTIVRIVLPLNAASSVADPARDAPTVSAA